MKKRVVKKTKSWKFFLIGIFIIILMISAVLVGIQTSFYGMAIGVLIGVLVSLLVNHLKN